MSNIEIKRIYEPYSKADGYRVLVDRLWPRGMKKEDANVDLWFKEIAPSTELRQWFHAESGRWEQFRMKYVEELKNSNAIGEFTTYIKKHQIVTLLYSVKGEDHNHALILKNFILQKQFQQ